MKPRTSASYIAYFVTALFLSLVPQRTRRYALETLLERRGYVTVAEIDAFLEDATLPEAEPAPLVDLEAVRAYFEAHPEHDAAPELVVAFEDECYLCELPIRVGEEIMITPEGGRW